MTKEDNLYSPNTINRIKKMYGFNLSKGLGQNFLIDKNIVDEIIYGSKIDDETLVIEIGPGIGVLTKEAAEIANKVIAIELDSKLIPILKDNLSAYNNVEIINNDVLKTDINKIIADEKIKNDKIGNVRVIGNLPYYITTPIVMMLLEDEIDVDSITVMMQREVAERMSAKPGTKKCGAITYAVNYYSEVINVCKASKHVFYPSPKVDSTVIRMDIKKDNRINLQDEELFFQCIKAGFGQRRKTLLNSLSNLEKFSKEDIRKGLNKLKIDENRRAETLSLEEFASISEYLGTKGFSSIERI